MVKERTGELDRVVGARLRAQRLAINKPLGAIAKEVGVSVTAIRWYETGRRQMTAQRIALMCRALSLSPNDLFGSGDSQLSDHPAYGKYVLRIATALSTLPPTTVRLMQGALNGLNQALSVIDESDVSAET